VAGGRVRCSLLLNDAAPDRSPDDSAITQTWLLSGTDFAHIFPSQKGKPS